MIDINVADVLPHEGQMMLLDKILEYNQQRMVAETIVRNDGLFGDGLTVPAWLGIEYMAQTVAAHGGMMRYLAGKPINIGFLLGTRRYNSNTSSFNVGDLLKITVERLIEDQGLSAFACQIVGDGIDISAKLNVYQPNEIDNRIFS
jgi:predicted hotdog family 3-hydroxylacyl-ACP dehydratase